MHRKDKKGIKDTLTQVGDEYKLVFDKSPIGILFYDKEGKLTNVNQSALQIMSIPKFEDVKGINIFDDFNISPMKNELLEKGVVKLQLPLNFDNIKKLGIYIPKRSGIAFIDLTISVIDSGFLMQIQDVTEHEKAEKEVETKEEQLRLSLEAANAGMWIRDPMGEWKATPLLNTFFGRSIDDPPLLEEEFRDYIHPEDLSFLEEAWRKAIDGESDYNQEYRVIWPDGSVHWLASKGKIILEDNNPRFMGITHDITERKEAEKELLESQERFRSVLDSSTDVIYRMNVKTGRFEYISPSAEAVVGFSPDELMALDAEKSLEMIHPEDRPIMQTALARLEEKGETTAEYRQITKNGTYRWISNHMSLIKDNKGMPLYRDGNIRDVTEPKKMEEELIQARENLEKIVKERTAKLAEAYNSLKESELKFKSLAENSPFAIRRLDKEFRFLYSNKGSSFMGLSKEDFIDRTIDEIGMSEDIVKGWKTSGQKAFQTGEIQEVNNEIPTSDGIITLKSIAVPEFDLKNEIETILVITQDITDLKNTERELRKSEGKFRQIAENIEEVFWIIDPRMSKIIYISPAYEKIWGRRRQSLYENPKSWIESIHPEDREYSMKKIWGKSDKIDEVSKGFEYRIIRPNGDIAWIWTKAFIVKDKSRDVNRITGIAIDITGRKNAEEQLKETVKELERSNEELQQFAYVSSHDLQEPLRTIASFTQLLERRYKGKFDSDADEFMEFIVEAAVRMKEQIEGLLEYSRVGTKGGEFEPVDINYILKQTIDRLDTFIKESDAEISYEKLPTVTGDAGQLQRVFQNLISNSIKFRKCEEQLKIQISAYKDEENNEYIFSIADNGIGIEEQYMERIFTIFQRLHTRDVYKGTGIGLSIVKRIIERHGGHVWVESEYGVGSTFYFTIPIKHVEQE